MKRWPKLPKVVDGMAGPIKVVVRRVDRVVAKDGDECWGLFYAADRKIVVAGKVPPALRWHSFAHEWVHAWMMDAGIGNIIHGKDEEEKERNVEIICDTLATAFVRSMARHVGMDPYEK